MRSTLLIAKLTFSDSLRNRWVLSFSIAFAALTFLLSFAGSGEVSVFSSFDRSSATLLHILMLFIPLLGFTLGAQSIAGDRESGSLVYLLSHPIGKTSLFFGKFLGAAWALAASITAGFALAAIGIGFNGQGDLESFVLLWAMALFFIVSTVGIGMLVSVLCQNRSRALGGAVVAWLSFTVFSDLGLMGTAYVLRLRSEGIVGLALLNPVEVFKILAVRLLANNLEVLGAGGMYLDLLFGKALPYLLAAWLLAFSLGALFCAHWIFVRQEEY